MFLMFLILGYYKVDVHIEENQENHEKLLWQVIFIDNSLPLSKERQVVLGKLINLDITSDLFRKNVL